MLEGNFAITCHSGAFFCFNLPKTCENVIKNSKKLDIFGKPLHIEKIS